MALLFILRIWHNIVDNYMLQAIRRITNLPFFRFSSQNSNHILRITRELLSNHQHLQPWKNIHTLHSLTLANQQLSTPNQTQTKQDQLLISQVLEDISSQLHQVPHQQINILMEVLRENGYRYSRELAIFRALTKQAKFLFGRQLRAELLPRSLFWLKALDFPKNTINRILQQLSKAAGKSNLQKDKKQVMNLSTKLELTIFCMQQPFVPIPILIRWLKVVLPETANSLAALCYLYHLVKVTDLSLRRKVEYQHEKTNARELLFNPYTEQQGNQQTQPDQPKAQESNDKKKETNPNEEFEKIEVKHRLNEMSQQVIKMINQGIDVKNLQKSIVKGVEDDVQPFKKEFLLYTCDIPELKPVVQHYVQVNLLVLTPIELIYLLKRCSKEMVDPSIEKYLKQLGEHMSVQQKVYVYAQSHKEFQRTVSKELIFELLDTIEQINYSEFMAITKLTELLSQSEHKYIGEVLRRIRSKMPAQQQSSAKSTEAS